MWLWWINKKWARLSLSRRNRIKSLLFIFSHLIFNFFFISSPSLFISFPFLLFTPLKSSFLLYLLFLLLSYFIHLFYHFCFPPSLFFIFYFFLLYCFGISFVFLFFFPPLSFCSWVIFQLLFLFSFLLYLICVHLSSFCFSPFLFPFILPQVFFFAFFPSFSIDSFIIFHLFNHHHCHHYVWFLNYFPSFPFFPSLFITSWFS